MERSEAPLQWRFGIGAAVVERWIARTFFAAAAAFLATAALLAATVPYRGWDPYAFGEWSRLLSGRPATENEWAACQSPHLTLVASVPSVFAVFKIE